MARLLSVVAVLMMIHPFRALYGVIFDTNQDEDNSNLLFLIGYGISG